MNLTKWLFRQWRWWQITLYPIPLLLGFLVYSSIYLTLLDGLGLDMHNGKLFNPISYFSNYLLMHFLFISIVEEFFCRLVPMFIAVRSRKPWVLYGLIVISSAAFGFIHGGFLNILYQGVAGLILCVIYLKSGGAERQVWKPFVVCIIVHTGYNLFTAMVGS